ncbi:MAG: hypothetical protein V3V74_07120 [Nitrosomonadaceae bacterium]
MNKPIQDRYTYRTLWAAECEEYVGICDEFYSLSWLKKDRDEALLGIKKLVHDVVEDMKKNNEPLPKPRADPFEGHPKIMSLDESARRVLSEAAYEKLQIEIEEDREAR